MMEQMMLPTPEVLGEKKRAIYTVGYGNRAQKEVFDLIFRECGPNVTILDVRAKPDSAWASMWKRTGIEVGCYNFQQDWDYKMVGSWVGNHLKLDQDAYWDWVRTKRRVHLVSFTHLCRMLIARGRKIVLLCAETKNFRTICHRVVLANHLAEKLDCEVKHIQ